MFNKKVWVWRGLLVALVVSVGLMARQWGVASRRPRMSHGVLPLPGNQSQEQRDHVTEPSPPGGMWDFPMLARILKEKLSQFPEERPILTSKPCDKITSGKPCVNTTCPPLPPSPATRLKEVMATRNQSLTLLPYQSAMAAALKGVSGRFRYVLVSAVSANHFSEMQAMVLNVHRHLLPRLTNFTFVLFDLGLTARQRQLTEEKCKCTVVDYPFTQLPAFFSELRCYTWKPNIIRSLIEKAEFLVWMDSSVRWQPQAPLEKMFQRSKQRGLQLGISRTGTVGVRTDHDTFHFYGDQACQYTQYGEVWATYGIFLNEPFVRHAVLDPWLSCAFSPQCMCVADHHDKRSCRGTRPGLTGVCHRFDQSSLGIIVSKLYGNRTNLVRLTQGINMARGETAQWFTD